MAKKTPKKAKKTPKRARTPTRKVPKKKMSTAGYYIIPTEEEHKESAEGFLNDTRMELEATIKTLQEILVEDLPEISGLLDSGEYEGATEKSKEARMNIMHARGWLESAGMEERERYRRPGHLQGLESEAKAAEKVPKKKRVKKKVKKPKKKAK